MRVRLAQTVRALSSAVALLVLLPALWLLSAGAVRSASPAPNGYVAVLADGTRLQGELVQISDAWQVTFQLEDGTQRQLDGRHLVRIVRQGRLPDEPTGPQVVLASGERIRGVLVSMDEASLRLRSESVGTVQVPLECVYGVILSAEGDPSRCNQLVNAIRERVTDADELWLLNEDRIRGTILGIDGDSIKLDQDGTELAVPRNQVRAVVLNRQLIACELPTALHVVAVLDDGSELRLGRAELRGNRLRGRTTYETQLTVPLERLRLLEFYGGNIVYLSDLEPARYKHVPYLGRLHFQWQRDRAIGGTPLRLRGQRYRKGLGVHSRAELTYRLDGQFELFHAVVGVDDNTGGGGSVVFQVLVDGEEKFRSEPLTGNSAPMVIRVPLDGAKELTLITDFGEFGDVLDHADWADAYLVRR